MFKNPIAPESRKADSTFEAPTKGNATTGKFMRAGDDYGCGYKTPVGSLKTKSIKEGPIPFGCKAYDPNELRIPQIK